MIIRIGYHFPTMFKSIPRMFSTAHSSEMHQAKEDNNMCIFLLVEEEHDIVIVFSSVDLFQTITKNFKVSMLIKYPTKSSYSFV